MLKFRFKSVKAIKSAELELADITVVTGNNATGKSTMAETVAAFVNASAGYEMYAAEAFLQQHVLKQFRAFQKFFTNIAKDEKFRTLEAFVNEYFVNSRIFQSGFVRAQALNDSMLGCSGYESILDHIRSSILETSEAMFLCGTPHERFFKQLFKDLNKTETMPSEAMTKELFLGVVDQVMDEAAAGCSVALGTRAIGNLPFSLRAKLPVGGVTVEEDGEVLYPLPPADSPLIGVCASLNQAVYLQSPYKQSIRKDDGVWRIGSALEAKDPAGSHDLKLDKQSAFLGGSLSWDEKRGEWMFTEGGRPFDLKDCATGIRAIADFKKLEQLQALDSGTILILDEPEAHLHPEWIVRYAGLLVHAVKEYGIHLLVATHSPMMTMALHDIAGREGLLKRFKCYRTETDQKLPRQATLVPLGDDIGPIFDQFNRSYDLLEAVCDEV